MINIKQCKNGEKLMLKNLIRIKKVSKIWNKPLNNLKEYFMKKLIINGKIKIIFNKNQENIHYQIHNKYQNNN